MNNVPIIAIDEIWKDVVGYEGLYQVSNLGNVRSLNFNHKGICKALKPHINESGYARVVLWKNKKPKTLRVHRLVAQAFISNPENKKTVNHENGIKCDNRVENLSWATISENTKHMYDVLGYKQTKETREKMKLNNKCNSKKVKINGKIFNSLKEASKYHGKYDAYFSEVRMQQKKDSKYFRQWEVEVLNG